ncbi:MAG: hypothetical protein RLZZ188_3244 [Verrucomicrobiota bacterium]
MGGASERGAFRRSRWSQGVRGAADVAAAVAADESPIAIDSHQVGSAVPADRLDTHTLSVFPKPASPRISRMTRMGKAAGRWGTVQSGGGLMWLRLQPRRMHNTVRVKGGAEGGS